MSGRFSPLQQSLLPRVARTRNAITIADVSYITVRYSWFHIHFNIYMSRYVVFTPKSSLAFSGVVLLSGMWRSIRTPYMFFVSQTPVLYWMQYRSTVCDICDRSHHGHTKTWMSQTLRKGLSFAWDGIMSVVTHITPRVSVVLWYWSCSFLYDKTHCNVCIGLHWYCLMDP